MANEEYEIGYGKPPEKTRFKPGQSGNPRGRPKYSKNASTLLSEELSERISLREGGKQIVLTKKQAMIKQLMNKALQGDMRALFFIYQQTMNTDINEATKETLTDDLSEEDNTILMRFLEENTKHVNGKNKIKANKKQKSN
jgi:hypothetical protein